MSTELYFAWTTPRPDLLTYASPGRVDQPLSCAVRCKDGFFRVASGPCMQHATPTCAPNEYRRAGTHARDAACAPCSGCAGRRRLASCNATANDDAGALPQHHPRRRPAMKIAVVGAGIAGLGAARALVGHDVTVFEAAARVGGHVHTVEVDGHAIDMGFIVCNRERYPRFFELLGELGVATRPTTMAFSVSLPDDDLEWGSASLSALFADRRKLVDVRHWRLLIEVLRFLRAARRDLATGALRGRSLDDYLAAWTRDIRDRFAVPLAAALWSLAPDRCGAFPAELFVRFLDHHGMLSPVRPLAWHTVVGGSRRYVDALVERLRARGVTFVTSTPVRSIARDANGVVVNGARFDLVIVATHADTALALLDAPTDDECRVLGAIRYSTNRTVLHTDRRFLPKRPAAHAAWNYVADRDVSRVAVTYSMTKLQGLPDRPYLVTLEPRSEPSGVLAEASFAHPQFDLAALAAQAELPRLGNAQHTFYAGAHFGFGFHEDGMRAGIAASRTGDSNAPPDRVRLGPGRDARREQLASSTVQSLRALGRSTPARRRHARADVHAHRTFTLPHLHAA